MGLIISLTPRLPVVIWGSVCDYADAQNGWIRLMEEGRETRRVRLGGLGSDGAFWSVMWAEIINHVSWSQQKSRPRVLANKCLPVVCACVLWEGSVDIVLFFINHVRLHAHGAGCAWLALCLPVFTERSVNVVIGCYKWPTFQRACQIILFNCHPSVVKVMYVCVCI